MSILIKLIKKILLSPTVRKKALEIAQNPKLHAFIQKNGQKLLTLVQKLIKR